MKIQEAIKVDPEIMSGAPCFSGTRVPVRSLFAYLEGGAGIDGFLEAYDWIKREQVIAVLEHASASISVAGQPANHSSCAD